MSNRGKIFCVLLAGMIMVFMLSVVAADTQSKPADMKELTERLQLLEKENLVLREDLGKARLDTRSALEAAAKRQAEAIVKINAELKETQDKMAAERAAQARRNRKLWIAVGVAAIAAFAAN